MFLLNHLIQQNFTEACEVWGVDECLLWNNSVHCNFSLQMQLSKCGRACLRDSCWCACHMDNAILSVCRTSRVGVWARESAQYDRLRRAHQMLRQRDSSADRNLEGEREPPAGSVPPPTYLNAVLPSGVHFAHLHLKQQLLFIERFNELRSNFWSSVFRSEHV